MKHAETWEAGMANREFKTIREKKLVCKALQTPSNARWSQQRGSCLLPQGPGDGHRHADGRGTSRNVTEDRLITAVLGSTVPKPHGGGQGEDQSRIIQMTGGNDQGWELYLYQPLKGWVWRSRRVRMLYRTMMKVRGSGARDT